MASEEIISFLKENVPPLENAACGEGYRASVTLVDGIYLPCVIFRNPTTTVDLAMRRFKEEQTGKSIFSRESGLGYREIVKTFVTGGNNINYYEIAKIDISNFAFPQVILDKIHGETLMSWTGFVAKMKDGHQFAFGTRFSFEFFNMPEGYTPLDIVEIINHSYLDEENNVKSYHSPEGYPRFDSIKVFRERPFFECFVEHL